MNRRDLATAEGAEAFVDKTLGDLHEGFKRWGSVPMMFYLFCTRGQNGFSLKDGEIGLQLISVPAIRSSADKDEVSEQVQKRIVDFRAIGVVFIAEAWFLKDKDAEGHYRKGASIKHHPNRTECVHVSLEHIRTGGVWRAFITRDGEGRGTLGPFVPDPHHERSEGRFTHLLHKERFA